MDISSCSAGPVDHTAHLLAPHRRASSKAPNTCSIIQRKILASSAGAVCRAGAMNNQGCKACSRSFCSYIPCLCCALIQLLPVPQQAHQQQLQPQQPQHCLQLPALRQGLRLHVPLLQSSVALDAPIHDAIQINTYLGMG